MAGIWNVPKFIARYGQAPSGITNILFISLASHDDGKWYCGNEIGFLGLRRMYFASLEKSLTKYGMFLTSSYHSRYMTALIGPCEHVSIARATGCWSDCVCYHIGYRYEDLYNDIHTPVYEAMNALPPLEKRLAKMRYWFINYKMIHDHVSSYLRWNSVHRAKDFSVKKEELPAALQAAHNPWEGQLVRYINTIPVVGLLEV